MVVNYTGGDTWVKSLEGLKVGGRMVTCSTTAGYAPTEDIRFIWTFELSLGSNGWARSGHRETLKLRTGGQAQGAGRQVYPLEVRRARHCACIEDREVFGKVVVSP